MTQCSQMKAQNVEPNAMNGVLLLEQLYLMSDDQTTYISLVGSRLLVFLQNI